MDSLFDEILVVIPARGGSKRITKKNIRKINGFPMILWPLEVLSNMFPAENVVVSTDSTLIKQTIELTGLNVPFMRPEQLSDDFTGTVAVVQHALRWFEDNIRSVKYVLTVYPTAVLITQDDIMAAIASMAADTSCDGVMPAIQYPSPIQRAVFEDEYGYASMFHPEQYSTRTQDLKCALHDAGQFYLNTAESIRKGKVLTNSKIKLQKIDKSRVIDIDTLTDFNIADDRLRTFKGSLDLKSCQFWNIGKEK